MTEMADCGYHTIEEVQSSSRHELCGYYYAVKEDNGSPVVFINPYEEDE